MHKLCKGNQVFTVIYAQIRKSPAELHGPFRMFLIAYFVLVIILGCFLFA